MTKSIWELPVRGVVGTRVLHVPGIANNQVILLDKPGEGMRVKGLMVFRTMQTMPDESRRVLHLRIKVPCQYECVTTCHPLNCSCASVQ